MTQLGRYQVKGELGRGGMGIVWRAYDPELDREVAIKSMHIADGAPTADQELALERFFREARAAAKLTHPNIVAVHDVLREGGTAYIVMELVKGRSLEAVTAAQAPADIQFAARAVEEAAAALDFAHQNGIVHRDVKPANILLDSQERVRLVDFGIARLMDPKTTAATMTAAGMTVGTLGYMAPEQIRGEAVTGAADQFSLAVVAYQLATGGMPFEGDSWISLSYKILSEAPPPPKTRNPALPAHAAAALEKALSKTPAGRFATCSDFARAFRGAVPVAGAPAPAKRGKWLGAGIAAVVLLAALGAWLGTRTRQSPEPPPPAPPVEAPKETPPPPVAVEPQPPPPVEITPSPDSLKLEHRGAVFEFATVAAGQFMMGSDDNRDNPDERPRHLVKITKPFDLGLYEVTRKQWQAVMGGPPVPSDEALLPKLEVSFSGIQSFLRKLDALNDGYRYRLPTEAEWEYAARAGTRGGLYGDADQIAWYQTGNVNGPIHVGQKEPNAWGFFDMLGNAWEWTADYYAEDYYATSPRDDPKGPRSGSMRVLRGGSYNSQGMILRCTYRVVSEPEVRGEEYGFRVAREKKSPLTKRIGSSVGRVARGVGSVVAPRDESRKESRK